MIALPTSSDIGSYELDWASEWMFGGQSETPSLRQSGEDDSATPTSSHLSGQICPQQGQIITSRLVRSPPGSEVDIDIHQLRQ
jgi:hypothetical protein